MSETGEAAPRPPNPHRPPPEVIREFNDRGLQWLFEDPENVRGALQLVAPALAAGLDFARAQRIIKAYGEAVAAGKGAVRIEGRLVEALHVEEARRTLVLADAITQREAS